MYYDGYGYLLNDLFGPVPSMGPAWVENESRIESLMEELQAAVFMEAHLCAEVDADIKSLQEQMDLKMALRHEITKPFEDKADAIRESIRELALAAGKSFKNGYGEVQFRKASKRRGWNLDALDAVCNSDEYIKTRIWLLRTETPVAASVSINLRM